MRFDENLVLHLLAASPGNRYQDTSGKYTISFCGAARPTPAAGALPSNPITY